MRRSAQGRDRFYAAFGSHPRPVLLLDSDGLVAANDAACVFFGFSESALLELGLSVATDHRGGWEDRLDQVFSGEEVAAAWFDFVRGVDGTHGAHLRATGVPSEGSGREKYVAVVEIDVSIDEPQRQADERRARKRYERLVDSAQEGIWEVDTTGRTVFANPRMAEILGCEVSELLGRSMFDFFDPDLAELVEAQFAVIREGNTDRFDAKCRRADGSTVWLMASAIPLFDEDGTWTGSAATAVDVTERRAHEQALRAAEELLRRTFEGAPIGMALVGIDGTWDRVNDAACEMLGRGRGELLASRFQDFTHPDDLDEDLDLVDQTLSGKRSGYSLEKRYLRPSGEIIWVTLTVALVRDERDRPLFFVSQFEDITARKEAELELERARLRTQRVLDRAAVAMAIIEADGRVSDSNPQFRCLFGNVRSADTTSIINQLGRSSVATFGELLASPEDGTVEADLELRDGTIVHLMATTIDDDSDGAKVLQALDVTVDRREHQRLELLAELDPLTNLANRRGLMNSIGHLSTDSGVAVVFIDLDGFKSVNDTLGHDEGDRVLTRVAAAISDQIRDCDLAARLGGDEFAVVLAEADQNIAAAVAQRVIQSIEALSTDRQHISASAGIACGNTAALTQLIDTADRAMLNAKRHGKNRVVVS
jgi:diguanylate cyclase (GGDEF)-like protein/PAS domain S-box-containing protein